MFIRYIFSRTQSIENKLPKLNQIFHEHYVQLLFSRSHLIPSKNFNYFCRRGKTGGHARRWSAKFHDGYVKQHQTNSRGSPDPDHYRYKTVLPDSHLPCHVTIANVTTFSRSRSSLREVQIFRISFFNGLKRLAESMYRKSWLLAYLTSRELKYSGDEIQTFVKEDRQIPHGIKEKPICEST